MQARAEEDEDDDAIRRRRQADGTPVTPETFAAWKVNSHIYLDTTRRLVLLCLGVEELGGWLKILDYSRRICFSTPSHNRILLPNRVTELPIPIFPSVNAWPNYFSETNNRVTIPNEALVEKVDRKVHWITVPNHETKGGAISCFRSNGGFCVEQAAFDLEMRGQKEIVADAIAKKPTGKEMFLRHLVVEEEEDEGEGDEGEMQHMAQNNV